MAEDIDILQEDATGAVPEPLDQPESPDNSGAEGSGEDAPAPPRDRVSERFAKLTRALADKDRSMATLQDQINQLREARVEAAPPQAPPSGKPRVEDFPDYDGYVEAVAGWQAEQVVQRREQVRQERETARQQHTITEQWQAKVLAAQDKYPDWDEAMQGAPLPVTPALREAIMTSDLGTDILHYLCTHEDEARALAALGPLQVARAVGRVEARLEASRDVDTGQVGTRLPSPPVRPVGGVGPVNTRDPGHMSPQEYRAWRERQRR